MSLLVLASAKGAPGVTTAALGLGLSWPSGRPVVVAELDRSGGDLAARLSLASEPGLVSLAATARRGLDVETLSAHTQLRAGVRVLASPPAPDAAAAAIDIVAGPLASVRESDDVDVLVDCGRLSPSSPAGFVGAAARILVLCPPRLDALRHLPALAAATEKAGGRLSLVLVGERPYPPAEVAEVLGLEVAGVVAEDASAAAWLDAGRLDARGLRHSRLLRSLAALASTLAPGETEGPTAEAVPRGEPTPAPRGEAVSGR